MKGADPPFGKQTIIKRRRLASLAKTQKNLKASKNRLALELFRVLEKVEIDRAQTMRQKADQVLSDTGVLDGDGLPSNLLS